MRLTLLFLLVASLLYASDIDKQINETADEIRSFDKKYSQINRKMGNTAKAILNEKAALLEQQKRLEELEKELAESESDYLANKSEMTDLVTRQETLDAEQQRIAKAMVKSLAKNASIMVLLKEDRAPDADAVITEEILINLSKQTQQRIKELEEQFATNTKHMKRLEHHTKSLQARIDEIEKKQKEAKLAKQRNEQALAKLQKSQASYKASLDKLLSQQDALRATLSRLNIVKEDEERKAREAAEERSRKQAKVADKELPKVKSVGSSYASVKTKTYRGKKTIAPLDSYEVVKQFGPYTDPIYQIKIFNESVSLKPTSANAKVVNVLNGKVILAQDTALLDHVVIIEHSDGLHTIYAHMDQIAPNIKKGKKVPKGAVIGRVSDELMFEVTQKNYHINPLQLIR